MVRAKFVVTEVSQRMQHVPKEKDSKGNWRYEEKPIDTVRMSPVTGDANSKFWTASPSGSLELSMTNPDAAGTFKLGQHYYVDFSEAPAEEKE